MGRTPDSQAMFAATTKKSFLLTDAADTFDVLEEAVNIAFEGRPGPVHIHVPEDLTERGVVVRNVRHPMRSSRRSCRTRRAWRRSLPCWRTPSRKGGAS